MTDYAKQFLAWAKDKCFKIDRIKKVFTPHEQAMKYSDECGYETMVDGGFIIDAVQISDNDMLIGVVLYWEETDPETHELYLQVGCTKFYYRLTDIELIDITAGEHIEGLEKRYEIWEDKGDNQWN